MRPVGRVEGCADATSTITRIPLFLVSVAINKSHQGVSISICDGGTIDNKIIKNHCIALLNVKQTFLDHILPLPAEKMAVLVDYCPTLRNTLDKSSLSCKDDADQRDQVAAWEAKWAFLALFMRSSGNSPFLGAIIRFFMLLHSLLQRYFNTARCLLVVYLHLYIVGE